MELEKSAVFLSSNSSMNFSLSLKHLQAEMARLDILLRREVYRWLAAGQDPCDSFRGLYISDAEAQRLAARPFSTPLGHTITLDEQDEKIFSIALAQVTLDIEEIRQLALKEGQDLPLERIRTIFGLSSFEHDTLLVSLAPHLDLRYEQLYGYLQDDVTRKNPTIHLILNLLGEPGPNRLTALSSFKESAPLLKHRLLTLSEETGPKPTSLLNRSLHVDTSIVSWILGDYQPCEGIQTYVSILTAPQDAALDFIAGPATSEVVPLLKHNPILAFYGPDQTSQEAAVLLTARLLGQSVLSIDMAGIKKTEEPPDNVLGLALRDTLLTGRLLNIRGWDVCLDAGNVPAAILTLLCDHPQPVIVSGQAVWQATGIQRTRPIFWLEFPLPNYEQRVGLWRIFMSGEERLSSSDLSSVASAFALRTGQICDAAASARELALGHGEYVSQKHLFIAARAHSNPNLTSLARKITPRYGWQDIVLPEEQTSLLREIVNTVRNRQQVLEVWGLGRKLVSSRGITVLFAGPPGTGKTMAAEVISAELGLDLYKIDLSTVVSKYIGETEKNLERIFAEAETCNAILFFDEADSLFGTRSEVRDSHDRYANIEISYLLQRMETFDGISVLATNLRANLDEAFTRRLQFAVDFPFPNDADRKRIWKALFPTDAPRADDLDFDLMAKRYKLAGGNIRNVLVSAAYLAAADGGVVNQEHLLHGVKRELQKMGRLVGTDDLTDK
jgi:hypothetical protein